MTNPKSGSGRPTSYRPARGIDPDNVVSMPGQPTVRMCDLQVCFAGKPVTEVSRQEGRYIIGRGIGRDLRIDHDEVSDPHFELVVAREAVKIRDLQSTNGTVVRNVGPACSATQVPHDDVILLSEQVSIRVLTGEGRARTAA